MTNNAAPLDSIKKFLRKSLDLIEKKPLYKILAGILVFLFSTSLSLGAFEALNLVNTSTGVDLSLSSSKTTYAVNEPIIVDIIANTNGLTQSAAELHISYPSQLQVQSFVPTTALPVVLMPASNGASEATIVIGVNPQATFTGVGKIATMTLIGTQASTSQLSFGAGTYIATTDRTTNALRTTNPLDLTITDITISPTQPINTPTPTVTQAPTAAPTIASGTLTPSSLSVIITTPVNGSTLPTKGRVQISSQAQSNTTISKMQISIDGKRVKTCFSTNFCSYSWNITSVTKGSHVIKVVATDTSGQTAQASVTVTKP